MNQFKQYQAKWEQTQQQIHSIGGKGSQLVVEPPATIEQIDQIENRLGYKLPESFRNVLLHYSKHVYFRWFFPDETIVPVRFREIFAGELGWNTEWIEDLSSISDDIGNGYGESLKYKLSFFMVGNGDYLCLDMNQETTPVVYWSHEEDEIYYIADSFEDYICNATELHCVGSEVWQLDYFLTPDGLDPKSKASFDWLSWFDTLTSTKLEAISHSVPDLLEFILVRGPVEEIMSVLNTHNPAEVFDHILIKLPDVEPKQVNALCTAIGEVLNINAADWVRQLWEMDVPFLNVYQRSCLTSRCLPLKEGLALVFNYLEQTHPGRIPSPEAKQHLVHFRSNHVIKWMLDKVTLPVNIGWDTLYAFSEPEWTDVVQWFNLEQRHQMTVLNALHLIYCKEKSNNEQLDILHKPSIPEMKNFLTQMKDKEILHNKKRIYDDIVHSLHETVK
ncbi:SMI1/KNR4 family protein [Paenibacillus silviterrae]|uniref:SMI1/KNR4 family protein n=1 Tax=Paenibacillus silviterrae TaxID=3242194 RepID=UPI0025436F81|nr:SMI1/KNR4 family protein [Paenibacillus chinjuensis]